MQSVPYVGEAGEGRVQLTQGGEAGQEPGPGGIDQTLHMHQDVYLELVYESRNHPGRIKWPSVSAHVFRHLFLVVPVGACW